ncbi:hypothetical protein KZ779_08245, partial [Escherichia coli]|nr:hypothetical protein [Escherichia coli]
MALKGGRADAPPLPLRGRSDGGLLFLHACHLSVTDDVPATATATATVLLFSCCSDSDYCSVVLSAGRTFGSWLP